MASDFISNHGDVSFQHKVRDLSSRTSGGGCLFSVILSTTGSPLEKVAIVEWALPSELKCVVLKKRT